MVATPAGIDVRSIMRAQFKLAHEVLEGIVADCANIATAKLPGASITAIAPIYAHALTSEIFPAGRWRIAVRGFFASNCRSAIRLKAMAQVRAQTIATKIRRNVFHPGQPRLSRAATTIAASANGRAKTVWESLTNSAQFLI